jgi:hypothetical protein
MYTKAGKPMGTVTFRPDYAKFIFECEPEVWNHIYRVFCETSHEMKFAGEFLKSHKTNRLWFNAQKGFETWTLEVWGEWAGIVTRLPSDWLLSLKRYDVRAIVWDASDDTIIELGQHLQRHVSSHNINVYSTKPASKRLGRDRGGKGFAIGSHKSDLRVTCYKRTGEPVAQEFQVTGAMLNRLKLAAWDWFIKTGKTIDPWRNLGARIEQEGNKRLMRVLESAGVGTYWPTVGAHDIPQLPPTQAAFMVELSDIIDEHTDLLGDTPG